MGSERGLGLYVHWPFCEVKCPYCDFNSHVREGVDDERWRLGLRGEMGYLADYVGGHYLDTIYFGGGTPSTMPWRTVEFLIEEAKGLWESGSDLEVTLEANPGTFDESRFEGYARAGVTRLSLGLQSLRDDKLKFLGRIHDVESARRALKRSSELFSRVSFDMIYGVPDEGLDAWREELREALDFGEGCGVGHMSLYQLTIERGTAFYTWDRMGKWKMPGSDSQADFFDVTCEEMERFGMEAYEVSNYARGGEASNYSRHNVHVWRYGDYGGIGPGAHGRISYGGRRYSTVNKRLPERWLESQEKEGSGREEWEEVDSLRGFEEALMMGLRLYGGVEKAGLESLRGCAWEDLFGEGVWEMLEEGGDVEVVGGYVRATRQGMRRLDGVLGRLLGWKG